jgi:hypothetical protein
MNLCPFAHCNEPWTAAFRIVEEIPAIRQGQIKLE